MALCIAYNNLSNRSKDQEAGMGSEACMSKIMGIMGLGWDFALQAVTPQAGSKGSLFRAWVYA